jgi:Nif-specific regulatory protein
VIDGFRETYGTCENSGTGLTCHRGESRLRLHLVRYASRARARSANRKMAETSRQPEIVKLLDLTRQLGAEQEVRAILTLMAKKAATLMEADRATIFLLDKDRNELWSQVTLDGEEIRFDARLGIAGACVMTGQVVTVTDAQQDTRFHMAIDARTSYRTKSVLAVPLLTEAGECLGTFQLLNKRGGLFNDRDQQLAVDLAAQVTVAIQRATTVERLRDEQRHLQHENTELRRESEGRVATERIVGTSQKIQAIVRLIDQLRDTSVDVLITGESGTGKEMIARAIHANSPRIRRPFIAINCAALPDNLVESELFGIERGVATGVDRRTGKFEEAIGGTLFLDEIGELSLSAQAKILRVLQERRIERVGGRTLVPVDVRIIAATNADLERTTRSGAFRSDLYYRLKVVTIQTPALREIPQDIPLLAKIFLDQYCRQMERDAKKLSAAAEQRLMQYDWPGNVRELENEIKRLVATTRKVTIAVEDLAENIRMGAEPSSTGAGTRSLKAAVEDLERRMIAEALARCRQSQAQTAKLLGLSRQGLIKKLKRYGIKTGLSG